MGITSLWRAYAWRSKTIKQRARTWLHSAHIKPIWAHVNTHQKTCLASTPPPHPHSLPPQQIHPTWPRPFAQQQNIVFNNSLPTAQPCTAPRTLAEFTLRKKKNPTGTLPLPSSFLTSLFFSPSVLVSLCVPLWTAPPGPFCPCAFCKREIIAFHSVSLSLSLSLVLFAAFVSILPSVPLLHPTTAPYLFPSLSFRPSICLLRFLPLPPSSFFLHYRPLGASLLPSLRSPALLICSRAGLQSMGGAICERLGTGAGWRRGGDDSPGLAWRLSQDKHTADWTNASYTPAGF